MADTEMEEVEVPCADTKCVEEEPLDPNKELNSTEAPKSPTFDTDLHLPDAPSVDQSEKKITTGDDDGEEDKTVEESSTPLKKGEPSAPTPPPHVAVESVKKWKTWLLSDSEANEVDEAGTPEDQQAFIKEVEAYNKEHFLDFKAPKFYGQPLNCLK